MGKLLLAENISDEMVHHVAFRSKRRKAKVAQDRHFEDFHFTQDGNGVMPLGPGPIIPEFPEQAAKEAGDE